jgi:hypothetical protein
MIVSMYRDLLGTIVKEADMKPIQVGQFVVVKADQTTAALLNWLVTETGTKSRSATVRLALAEAATRRGARVHYYTREDHECNDVRPGRPPVEGYFFPPSPKEDTHV